jgi:hypothetical protein
MCVIARYIRVTRFGKLIEELDAESKVGDDDENFRGDLHPYISVGRQHQSDFR